MHLITTLTPKHHPPLLHLPSNKWNQIRHTLDTFPTSPISLLYPCRSTRARRPQVHLWDWGGHRCRSTTRRRSSDDKPFPFPVSVSLAPPMAGLGPNVVQPPMGMRMGMSTCVPISNIHGWEGANVRNREASIKAERECGEGKCGTRC